MSSCEYKWRTRRYFSTRFLEGNHSRLQRYLHLNERTLASLHQNDAERSSSFQWTQREGEGRRSVCLDEGQRSSSQVNDALPGKCYKWRCLEGTNKENNDHNQQLIFHTSIRTGAKSNRHVKTKTETSVIGLLRCDVFLLFSPSWRSPSRQSVGNVNDTICNVK